jgi:glucokinase-like ROK family protein
MQIILETMVTKSKQPSERDGARPRSVQSELSLLRLIHANGKVSRIDLAKATRSSAASITIIAQRLLARGVIVESGQRSTHYGRKPVLLSLRDDAAYLVGVDLGSFFLRVVIVDVNGHIIYKTQTETHLSEGRDRVLKRTFQAIHQAIEESRIPRRAINGIGMGHSAVIDSERGIVLSLPRPGQMLEWKNVRLKEMLEKEFDLPCLLEDSVKAIAIAEKHFGVGLGLNDFIYIDVGMGIGAGIFIGGNLYRGPGGHAGEFGHMTVDERGPLCCCGSNGCLEAMASGAAITQAIRLAIDKGVDSKVREMADGNLDRITFEHIAQAAMQNDALAFRVLDEAISHIGVALADVVNLLNPKVVIFGGGLFRAAPQLLLEALKRPLKQRALEQSANEVQLKGSSLGSEAGALGAARLISERVLERVYERS